MGEVDILRAPNGEAAVQRRAVRHDGWTAAKRETFLSALAQTANVKTAAGAAGMSTTGAYAFRRRDPGFARQWCEALAEGVIDLEFEMLERARRGTVETVERNDGYSETRRSFSDKLAMFLVARHRPVPMPPVEAAVAAGRSAAELCAELERRIAAIGSTAAD